MILFLIKTSFLSFLILLVVAAPTLVYCECKDNWNLLKHLVLSDLVCGFVIWLILRITGKVNPFFGNLFISPWFITCTVFIYMPVLTLVNSIVNFILAEPGGGERFKIDTVKIAAGVVLNVCVWILINYVM
jgi:hypothetical protein